MSSHDDASRSSVEPTDAPSQASAETSRAENSRACAASLRQGTVFQLTRDLVSLPESLRLRNVEWGVLFAVTGEHTVAQISAHFGLEDEEQKVVFSRLLSEGLIAEREVSYGEYLRAAATIRDDQPKTLARFLRAGVTFGPVARISRAAEREPGSNRSVVARVAGPSVGPTAGSTAGTRPAPPSQPPASELPEMHQTRAIPTFSREQLASFEPLEQPAEQPPVAPAEPLAAPTAPPAAPAEPRRLSLKRVMQFILDRAPDLNAGQLDIYRVFIRVNTKLLRRNGINTLRFEEDRLIADPELQHAITASVEKTLGLTCPKDVYLAA